MVNRTEQAVVVTDQTEVVGSQGLTRLAFFNDDGTPFVFGDENLPPAAAQANSTAATVGDLVTDFNALLAKLRTAGYLAE